MANPTFTAALVPIAFGRQLDAQGFDTRTVAAAANVPAGTAWLLTAGYAAAGDGGGSMYKTAVGTGPGNFQSADGQWWQPVSQPVMSVKIFGAVGNGVADDTVACQAAITYMANQNGGTVWFSAGTFLISSTLSITANAIILSGIDEGGFHDTGTFVTGASILKWGGAGGGTMLNITAQGGTQRLLGNGCTGIYFSPGAGCANGINLASVCSGRYDVAGDNFSTAFVTVGFATGLSEGADSQHNVISVAYSGFTAAGSALVLTGNTTANASFNIFPTVTAEYKNGNTIVLVNADNNLFENVHLFRGAGGSGIGVVLQAGATSVQTARNNLFLMCSPGVGGLYAEGTEIAASESSQNQILFYDQTNSVPAPTIGTGDTNILFWAGSAAPPGLRTQTLGLPAHRTDASGVITQQGKTGSITSGGGTAVITLSPAFPSAVLSLSLCPITTGAGQFTAVINGGLTQVTVTNNGGTTSDCWYEFKGY